MIPINDAGILSTYADSDNRLRSSSTPSGLSCQRDSHSQTHMLMVCLRMMSTLPSLSELQRLVNRRSVCFGEAARRLDRCKVGRATSFHPPQDSSVRAPRSKALNWGALRALAMNKCPAPVDMDMSPAVRSAIEKLRRAVTMGGEIWMLGRTEASCDSCCALKAA